MSPYVLYRGCGLVSEQPEFLTTEEAADILKVSQKTVLRWINSGRLRACRPGRAYRIRVEDLPGADPSQRFEVIYLDDNASNPIHPIVRDAIVESLNDPPANASSSHVNGVAANYRVGIARESVAELVDASASEVVFTAGATEANNLILRGFHSVQRRRVLISATEHSSITVPAQSLQDSSDTRVDVVPVDSNGQINLAALEELLDETVALVSIAAANSETGVINPLEEIAHRAHAVGAVFHSDATQFVGRLPFSMRRLGVDALSLSGHKMNGPQGVGALVVDRRIRRRLKPFVFGGGHEDGLRSGSSNVAGIVGLGAAARLAADPAVTQRMRKLRDQLADGLVRAGGIVNAGISERLPNTVNVRFPGALGDVVLARTPLIAASLGSACNAGAIEPSTTLLAMGLDRTAAQESIRFSVTRFTTNDDIADAIAALATTVAEVRQLAQEVA
jgi:cysteine desulfurase